MEAGIFVHVLEQTSWCADDDVRAMNLQRLVLEVLQPDTSLTSINNQYLCVLNSGQQVPLVEKEKKIINLQNSFRLLLETFQK